MAYTYNDFVTAATNAGLMNQFDSNDIDLAKKYPEYGLSMVSLKRDLSNAKTNEQQLLANEAINQLRKNYGSYWTGDQGNRSYAASYGSKINDTLDKIKNYGDFKWDPETDELFSTYKKTYLREGDRAAANALAAAAAASGGNVSSYAQQAAQQAGNYFASKVADAIPELRNQRYGEWQGGFDMLQKVLGNYQTQDESDYKRYLDMVNAEYQRERDAVADAEKELQNALTIYQLTGTATGALKDLLAAAGIGTGSGGSSGGGGGGGGGGSVKASNTYDKISSGLKDAASKVVAKIAAASADSGVDAVSGAAPSAGNNTISGGGKGSDVIAFGGKVGNNTSAQMAAQAAAKAQKTVASSKSSSSSGKSSGKAVTTIKALGA